MPKPPTVEVLRAEFVLSWPRWRGRELDPVLPQVCFAGRSNVGKSSLLNCLSGRKGLARTSNTPGRTQALNVFRIGLRLGEEQRELYFVDLPGYGYAKAPPSVRAQWSPMMESFLKDNAELRAAVLLFDIRREPNRQDIEVLELLERHQVPLLPVATKVDKVGTTRRGAHMKVLAESTGIEKADFRPFSAPTRQGREDLLAEIFELAAPRESEPGA